MMCHCMNDPQPEGHMASYIRRRQFLASLGGAAAWPLAARAQQAAALVVGFVSSRSLDGSARHAASFSQGLSETGYVEGQNVTVEYHWLDGKYDRPPLMGIRDRPISPRSPWQAAPPMLQREARWL